MKRIEWILRIAMFGEFLGHGIFCLRQHPPFLRLISGVTGVEGEPARIALNVIGTADVAIALSVLIKPYRFVLLWGAFWGFLTALARPLSGLPIWDFVERWPNWAVPLALWLVLRSTASNEERVRGAASSREGADRDLAVGAANQSKT